MENPTRTQNTENNPSPITRSEPNPYPTTFVQADTSTFKNVVQMLTGNKTVAASADPPPQSRSAIPPIRAPQKNKLYERRNHSHLKNSLIIATLVHGGGGGGGGGCAVFSPREILSPSMLNFPKLALSPVTPLNRDDPFTARSPSVASSSSEEEERAIAAKGFYLHPSPRGAEPPQLLPLFPVTSPRVSLSAASQFSTINTDVLQNPIDRACRNGWD